MTKTTRSGDSNLHLNRVKSRALTMTSALALLSCMPALVSQAQAQEGSTETVTVSASRITRDGFQAPTPTTVVGAEDIEAQAKPNIFSAIQELPSLMGSQGVENGTGGTSGGTNGLSSFAMRGLGTIRTLTLVDGQRIVPSNVTGVTDISELPQLLIQRVDVVTGGASASWGSDAVAGVVNFIVDKRFTGFKANVSSGISTYGDNFGALFQMAAGTGFAGDRGHVEASAEYSHDDGVDPSNQIYGEGKGAGGRSWFNSPVRLQYSAPSGANGPPAGQPQFFNAYHGQDFQLARYGIITTGPLQGIAFAENGQPTNFVYGNGPNGLKGVPTRNATGAVTNCVSPWCIGGDTSSAIGNGTTLASSLNRLSLYGRLSYQLLPNLNLWMTAQFGEAQTRNTPSPGSWFAGGQTILCGNAAGGPNAFLPASVNSACVTNNITSFGFGTVNAQIPDRRTIHTERNLRRYVWGADGNFSMFGTDWTWNAYAEHGETETHIQIHIPLNPYLLAAQDSVLVTPANLATYSPAGQALGTIVCRSTVAIGLGCVPYNPFGNVTPTQATVNWIFGGPHRFEGPSQQTRFDEEVFAINLNGEPFSTWAGPVSFATGFEYRKDGYNVWGDPASQGGAGCTDPLLNCVTGDNWYAGNFHNGHGAYNVMEGYVETVIPLMKSQDWGAFDLDLGGRATGYSTSGYVNTWKVGATWDTPMPGLRLRGVMSRDIRAPNLSELFSASTVANGTVTNPFLNGVGGTVQVQNVTAGNPNLKPEKAQSTEVGLVYQPDWFPGFSASIDYYRVYYTGGINNLSSANIIELCRLGFLDQCANIITNPAGQTVFNNPTAVWRQVVSTAFNLASTKTDGFDFEFSYRFSLEDEGIPGNWTLRLLTTHVSKFISTAGLPGTVPHESAGENGGNIPHWKVLATQGYSNDRWSFTTTERYVSDGRQNTQYVVCTPGSCPVGTSNNPTINSNGLRGQFLLDVGGSFNIDDHWQIYGKIDNITNVDPTMIYSNAPNNANAVNAALYDVIGRMYRIGMRLKM